MNRIEHTIIEKYAYDNREEKDGHSKEMEESGFIDSGQIKKNVGTIGEPKYIWYGEYYSTIYE